MPIYEYICHDCGKSCELIVSASTKPVCEHCGSKNIEKQLSVFAAHAGSSGAQPPCAGGCGGFERGSCGSGCCGMRG